MKTYLTHNLEKKAYQLRREIIKMIYKARSGHPGGSLSIAEIMTVLYFHVLRLDPKYPDWPDRDRFILSKGHACPAWYTIPKGMLIPDNITKHRFHNQS